MTSAEDVSVVAEWLGEAGVRDVNGTVPIAADRLSYFSVVLADWTRCRQPTYLRRRRTGKACGDSA